MDKIAVLIPCLNEEKTIAKVVSDFKRELPDATIYIYDNNSIDATKEIAQNNGAIVRHEQKRGKGNVVRKMFREVDAQCYLLVDGDDTYPADAANRMCREVLDNQVDMVIGDRMSTTYKSENKRRFHNFGNVLVRKLVNSLFNADVHDVMSGYRAFSQRFVKAFPVLSTEFEIETEMTIHTLDKNISYTQIPIKYKDRPAGSESKLNTFVDGMKVLKTIFNLFKNYKPLPFFSLIASLCALVSVCMFIPVLIKYMQTGFVGHFPTLIVSGFVMIVALLSFSCGLILDTVIEKDRRAFEINLSIIQLLLDEREK